MRSARELWKENDDRKLTPEEKVLKYGVNPPREMRYSKVKQNGEEVIVAREFLPGEVIPKDWKPSPADFGVETQPGRHSFDPDQMPVIAKLPAAQKPADDGKAEK